MTCRYCHPETPGTHRDSCDSPELCPTWVIVFVICVCILVPASLVGIIGTSLVSR